MNDPSASSLSSTAFFFSVSTLASKDSVSTSSFSSSS